MSKTLLTQLRLVDFRNSEQVLLEPSERFNIIAGHNGAGKTNLLEAIYLLGSLRSFRTQVRGELIRHGSDEARIAGVFGGAAVGLKCEIGVSRTARTVRIDGKTGVVPGDHNGTNECSRYRVTAEYRFANHHPDSDHGRPYLALSTNQYDRCADE